jgi:hypothetical protein
LLPLPRPIAFQTDPDASKDHLLTALEVDAQLDNVTVPNRIQPRRHTRRTQTHIVQKGSRGAANVLDVPLAVCEGEFAVFSANDLGFEADGSL